MTQQNHEDYEIAVGFAQEAFEEACREADALPVAGSMCSHDISRHALEAKHEAEERYGVALTLTLDGDWNWTFS